MKKKHILNLCMIVTIMLIAVCGIMAVGSVKGWFGGQSAHSDMTVMSKSGIAMIERNGVSYEVSAGTALRDEDRLNTKTAATLTIAKADEPMIYMGNNAELSLHASGRAPEAEILQGEMLLDARAQDQMTATIGTARLQTGQAVTSVSVQSGSAMVYVYAGNVTIDGIGTEPVSIDAGNVMTIMDGQNTYSTSALAPAALSDAQITQLLSCGLDDTFCITTADLTSVQNERETEIQKAQQEALQQKEEAKKQAAEAKRTASAASNQQTAGTGKNATETGTQSGTTRAPVAGTDAAVSETEEKDTSQNTEDEDSGSSGSVDKSCTIKIVCDTILDNMENLTPGKEGYVPSNGKILGTTSITFSDGETVFDVLKRACDSAGIQLEYSYTPMYESYYIEGINHLYEFDCGNESGWMYKVNGWFPNYGCSKYTLEDGDTIVWCYTCNGLGADVGGGM